MSDNVIEGEIDKFIELIGESLTGDPFKDRSIIRNALRYNSNQAENIASVWFDLNNKDTFIERYQVSEWDPTAFGATREGDPTPIIYGVTGSESFAPSRPPSRSDNRSPLPPLLGEKAQGYTDADENDPDLARALANSRIDIGGNAYTSNVQFGPANRDDYDPSQWSMVTQTRIEEPQGEPDPSFRKRKPKQEVFLRTTAARSTGSGHRLGALMMIFHKIPGARNALLLTGNAPAEGYGNHKDWWEGTPILPAGGQPTEGGQSPIPNWEDEVCRLIAFLDDSDRSYGTIDTLAGETSASSAMLTSTDPEKEFFHQLANELENRSKPDVASVFISDVEVINYQQKLLQALDRFGILELSFAEDAYPSPSNLYNVWDLIFYTDVKQTVQTPSDGRIAWISYPADVITCRLQYGAEMGKEIDIPEVFYLDRYLKDRSEEIFTIQTDMLDALDNTTKLGVTSDRITTWENPKTKKMVDRRVMAEEAIALFEAQRNRIKNFAYWRDYEAAQAAGVQDLYYVPAVLTHIEPQHHKMQGEPELLPDEIEAIAHLETKIKKVKAHLEAMDQLMQKSVTPGKRALDEVAKKLFSYLTVPGDDERWNPTHKYTLCGVVNTENEVFIRADAGGDDSTSPEMQWKRITYNGGIVSQEFVTFKTVAETACGKKSSPLLVYATDEALNEDPLPLNEAQKNFVKRDNRLFQQELAKKRSAEPPSEVSQSKKLQKSSSMDSLATNKASAGSLDGDYEMTDADSGGYVTFDSPPNFQEMQQVATSTPLLIPQATNATTNTTQGSGAT